ncbi:2-hydroxyacid dehydrogenase [Tuwongella immobilis]|nr:D-glycerate dehydrogenase [Tuwongella immobilis]
MRPKVFVSRMIPQSGLKRLQERCEVEVWPDRMPPAPEVLRAKIADCDGIVSLLTDRIDAPLMDAAPRLKVVSNFAVGVNNIDLAAATERGIAIGNTPGVLTDATADIAVTLLLAAARRLGESMIDAREGRWLTWEPTGWLGQDIGGRTLGIVGMGRIGLAMARRMHYGWGMPIVYTSRTPKPEIDAELKARRVELPELLAMSDYVSVHADLNPSTKGLFGADQFRQMKPTAVFINTSRGPLVDQDALVMALREGLIFSAGLDVTDPEPLPPTHPLYAQPNCVIAPHIASATVQTRDEMARICAENLLAGVLGQPLTACANPAVEPKRRR